MSESLNYVVFVAHLLISDNGRQDNLYLVPMHGGIWTLCIDMSETDMRFLGRSGFPNTQKCVNYLADEVVMNGDELYRNTGFPSNYHPRISKYLFFKNELK